MHRPLLLLLPLVFTVLGCQGGNTLPPETDPTAGRALLKTTLDTWMKGGSAEDLKSASPAIIAFDPDWSAGAKLVKYEIAPTDGRVGVDLLVKVTLTLIKDGKTSERTVNFCIAIGSQNAVLRQT